MSKSARGVVMTPSESTLETWTSSFDFREFEQLQKKFTHVVLKGFAKFMATELRRSTTVEPCFSEPGVFQASISADNGNGLGSEFPPYDISVKKSLKTMTKRLIELQDAEGLRAWREQYAQSLALLDKAIAKRDRG